MFLLLERTPVASPPFSRRWGGGLEVRIRYPVSPDGTCPGAALRTPVPPRCPPTLPHLPSPPPPLRFPLPPPPSFLSCQPGLPPPLAPRPRASSLGSREAVASARVHPELCLTLAFVYNDRYYFYTQNKENTLFWKRTSLPLEFNIFQSASSAALSIRPSVCPQGTPLPVLCLLRPLP